MSRQQQIIRLWCWSGLRSWSRNV